MEKYEEMIGKKIRLKLFRAIWGNMGKLISITLEIEKWVIHCNELALLTKPMYRL